MKRGSAPVAARSNQIEPRNANSDVKTPRSRRRARGGADDADSNRPLILLECPNTGMQCALCNRLSGMNALMEPLPDAVEEVLSSDLVSRVGG